MIELLELLELFELLESSELLEPPEPLDPEFFELFGPFGTSEHDRSNCLLTPFFLRASPDDRTHIRMTK
jgi:hypothetical protein